MHSGYTHHHTGNQSPVDDGGVDREKTKGCAEQFGAGLIVFVGLIAMAGSGWRIRRSRRS